MTILKRNGIPGPTPNFIYGNLFDIRKKPNVLMYNDYFAKYGKIMGYYVGKKPSILINDYDLIKQIQIKDFNKFPDRNRVDLKYGLRPNPKFHHHLISAQGSRWKEIRTILNPTFSAMKLKTMTPIMDSAIDIMLNKIEQSAQKKEEFDIYTNFQLLTTDVIAKCALGINTDVQNNPDDQFYKAAKKLFDTMPSQFLLMFTCFPELDIVLYPLRRFLQIIYEMQGKSTTLILSKLIHTAINLRDKVSTKKNDLLQLMLDAKASEEEIKNTNTDNLTIDLNNEAPNKVISGDKTSINDRNVKALTTDEVVANAIIFYEAGYETTSTALGFIAHVLVNNPQIQEKVREEVLQLYKEEGKFDYNTVNKLTYMQCVINETMRFYPPVTTFVTRTANEDYNYKDITIPKNSTVRIPVYQLHHNEEYWPNHNVFDPERFRDKANIDPVTFQPFGTGPRNCIGMRFALYEMKLALSKLLSKYRLVPGPSTEKDLTVEYKVITETPKHGVFVKAIPI